jgi:ATP-binding cassette subfamily B protein/ATP-binding cassette subfamily C protein/ATP-binding cassette subfamily B multidrug efflux pump
VQAAKLAAVHEDILRLPHGYYTPVGERGVTLSGGQRQRVALARALLSDAPLLLLDDTLSAVDTDTEARILAHLRQARVSRTTIIVSHRLSAVADADEIIALREGRVVEQGDHATLLAATAGIAPAALPATGGEPRCRLSQSAPRPFLSNPQGGAGSRATRPAC